MYDGCSDREYRKGTILLAAPPDDKYVEIAKEYIKKYNLTAEDVKIMRNEKGINVITKRALTLTILDDPDEC